MQFVWLCAMDQYDINVSKVDATPFAVKFGGFPKFGNY